MFEPHLPEPDPQSKKTYPQKVFCVQHNREAEIVVATWPYSEEGWNDWRVIDCSVLPPGAIRWGMDCLSRRDYKVSRGIAGSSRHNMRVCLEDVSRPRFGWARSCPALYGGKACRIRKS